MNRKIPVSIALAITIIAMTLTFSITWVISMRIFDEKVSSVTQLQQQYSKLAEIDTYVRGNFYGDIDDDYLFDRVAAGYMNGLGDRYSVYYTAEEYQRLLDIESGALVGVGVEVLRAGDGSVTVAKVYGDSPAARVGITQGARLTKVNGTDVKDFASLADIKNAMLGAEGTELVLTCLVGLGSETEFRIQRTAYTAPTVESMIIDGYAYIRISSFTENTLNEFDYALRQAESAGVLGLIFDVRSNSGSLFRNTYDIIDMLCPLGTIAKSVNKSGASQTLATSNEAHVDLPMAVLVDGATSAGAELFAISIRDLAGGRIVGARTVGRGTIQSSPNRLADGSAVVVTRAILYTGKDETFNGVGIEPDLLVDGETVDENSLLNPDPSIDPVIRRGMEVVRTMVREAGGDPNAMVSQPSSESEQPIVTSEPPVSSEPVSGEGTSGVEGEGTGEGTEGDATTA